MSARVIQFPGVAVGQPPKESWEARLRRIFRGRSKEDMRRFWDEVGDDSFYHGPEGDFDCADIHGYMNIIGDGAYCAV